MASSGNDQWVPWPPQGGGYLRTGMPSTARDSMPRTWRQMANSKVSTLCFPVTFSVYRLRLVHADTSHLSAHYHGQLFLGYRCQVSTAEP